MAIENGVSEERNAGINEISQLLLQGWTMLADVCPREGCNMPLMRSRQGRVLCCSCRANIERHEHPPNTTPDVNRSARPSTSEAPPSAQTVESEDADAQASDVKEEVDIESEDHDHCSHGANALPTQADQLFPKPPDSSFAPASSERPENSDVATRIERTVDPTNAGETRDEVDELFDDADRNLYSGWRLTREVCENCRGALLNNVLDGRKECLTCGHTIEPGARPASARPTTTGLAPARSLAPPTLDVVRSMNRFPFVRHHYCAARPSTVTLVPSPGRETRRTPVAPSGHTHRAGVGASNGGSGGMLNVGSGASGGLGAARMNGPTTVNDVPTLEPRSTAAATDPDEFMGDVEFDVDRELHLSELAVARNLRNLRCALADASDAETIRVLCAAIVSAADAVAATRHARLTRSHVPSSN